MQVLGHAGHEHARRGIMNRLIEAAQTRLAKVAAEQASLVDDDIAINIGLRANPVLGSKCSLVFV